MVDPALGSISIWEVRSDGSQLRQLEFAANAGHGLWTVNGDYYFYNTWQLNQHLGKDIWVTSDSKLTQGKYASVRLTSGPLVFSDLALSGDGQTLFTMGTQARIELTRYDNQTKTFEPFLGRNLSHGRSDLSRWQMGCLRLLPGPPALAKQD